jgi:hypothetical protein
MTASSKWTWADFIRRCRSRSLGLDDIIPLSNRVLLPWFVFCTIGLLINTDEELIKFAGKNVPFTSALAWIGLFGFLSYCAAPRKPLEILSVIWKVFWPIVTGVIYAYITIGIFLWVNALAGSQESVTIHGPVIKMYDKVSARYGGHGWYVTIKLENRDVELDIPRRDYEQVRVGDEYAVKMRLGALGYFYRWPKIFSD